METFVEHQSGEEPIGKGSALSVELRTDGTRFVLKFRGELCGTSVAALEAQIDQLGTTPHGDVVADLEELTGVDLVGMRALVSLSNYLAARGRRLTVIGVSDDVGLALGAWAEGFRGWAKGFGRPLDDAGE